MRLGTSCDGVMPWISRAWRDSKNQFLACLALNFLVLIPIILHVPLYLDDYARASFGFLGWAKDARPLADVLFLGLNLGTPIVAVSPLYQFGALFVISITCVVTARAYGITNPWIGAIATLPLMGQPYYLANLSFGFDSLSMSLAQFFAVTAAVVLLTSRARASYGIALLLLLATLLTYQPSASSFLSFGLMFSLAAWLGILPGQRPSAGALRLLKLLSCYAITLGIFALFVRLIWRNPSAYAARASKLIDLDSGILSSLARNTIGYLKTYLGDWSATPILFFIGLQILLLLGFTWLSWRRAALIAVSLSLILAISPGAVILLANPPHSLPRTLVFVGPLLASLALQVVRSSSGWQGQSLPRALIRVLPMGLLAWSFILFSFAYGQAARAQEMFVAGRLSRLISAVSRLEATMPANSELKGISYVGVTPRSPILQNSTRRFPLMDRLVFRIIGNNNDIGSVIMSAHGLPMLKIVDPLPQDLSDVICQRADATAICTSEFLMEIRGEVVRIRMN